MAKIKIDDLSRLEDLSPEEAKGIFGGAAPLLHPQTDGLVDSVHTDDLMRETNEKASEKAKADAAEKKKGSKRP